MKESNAVTSAKTKQITPEVLEEAIEWLETETYCCYALTCALSGYEYDSFHTKVSTLDNLQNSQNLSYNKTVFLMPELGQSVEL